MLKWFRAAEPTLALFLDHDRLRIFRCDGTSVQQPRFALVRWKGPSVNRGSNVRGSRNKKGDRIICSTSAPDFVSNIVKDLGHDLEKESQAARLFQMVLSGMQFVTLERPRVSMHTRKNVLIQFVHQLHEFCKF